MPLAELSQGSQSHIANLDLAFKLGYKQRTYFRLKETDWHSQSAHNSARWK